MAMCVQNGHSARRDKSAPGPCARLVVQGCLGYGVAFCADPRRVYPQRATAFPFENLSLLPRQSLQSITAPRHRLEQCHEWHPLRIHAQKVFRACSPESGLARMTYNASSRPPPYGRASGSTTRLLAPATNTALPGFLSMRLCRHACHILRYAPGSRCAGTSPDLSCGPPGTMRFCTCCLSATFTCTNGNSSFLTCARVRQALRKSFCAAASRLCL